MKKNNPCNISGLYKKAEFLFKGEGRQEQNPADFTGCPVQMTLPLNNDLEVRSWILSWGPYARVLAPQNLAQEIAGTIQKMAARTTANA